jgi:hypothetical protein
MKTGVELIAEERQEQIEKHGFDVIHDVEYYSKNELIQAACFAIHPEQFKWPAGWDEEFASKIRMKPNKVERLKVAGALIAAEIDRLQNTNV